MYNRLLTLIAVSLLAVTAQAQTRFILRYTESEPLPTFLARYNLQLAASVPQRPIHSVIDNQGRNPLAIIQQISDDTDDDVSIELDQIVRLPILSFQRRQTNDLRDFNRNSTFVNPVAFFGVNVPQAFVRQNAARQAAANSSWNAHGGGTGTVAIIDTGVDGAHPLFGNSVLSGIDLIAASGNGSELTGLSRDILALINPTTTPLLGRETIHLSRGHAPQWERSVRVSRAFGQIPLGLGHGTMVAGAVKLVAPQAKILPIRAFGQDGTGRLFHVISGIHQAEIRGARIVNLSLNTLVYSPEFERTAKDVSDRGVILVASTGNDGLINPLSYPARFNKVTAVASVTSRGALSQFSNAGPDITTVAAPGEALYLPFPGNRYAAGWGTSFSAPLVSGLAAKILSVKPQATYSDLQSALGRSNATVDPNLGLGTLNVFQSVAGL